ncbi:MAG TPA: hypothetical protein VGM25_15635 [Caulobacteraceae bacterium]
MRRVLLIIALSTALLSVGAGALAQGYPPLSFPQMIQLDLALIRQQHQPERPGDLFFNPSTETGGAKARAVYTGQSRPLDQRKQAFINAFASTSIGNERYATLYEREYRFTAGGQDWWLPVQSQVAGYFAKELKAGQSVSLYIRNAGGFRQSDSWDWVFLVEEFDTPEGVTPSVPPGKAPPEKGQPQPKKPPVPKGPKIET